MMLEQLKDIDESSIKELRSIKKEQETLRKRLEAMEKKKGEVSDVVFGRVRADYEARYEELEEGARPLKQQARAEYIKLKALLTTMAESLDEARLAKEELSFRHDLGEFAEKEFKSQVDEIDQRLQRSEAELKEGEELKGRFVAAFHSEEELEEAAGPSTSPPPPPPPEAEPAAAEETDLPPEPEAGAEKPAEERTADAMEADATAMLELPRLISQADDGAEEEYPLAMGSTTIGRLDDNDICIPDGTVSRHHARIDMTDDGFTIVDLKSENGVFVNGERIEEHFLKDGDQIEIGPGTKEFVFKSH
jgi:hypothetical protein